ncbi:MAG TPA: ATP-binding cassette domain-containing protein [Alphaproteobacteria bacterium]|nr:ATP-binding cassette domain-containing protein [Alphaproteobacteria bacterium]
MAPPIIALKGASVAFGPRQLFAGLDVGVGRGERACLVGRNGSGKSTLLKAMAGLVDLDAGERFVQPGIRVAYLAQETPAIGSTTVAEHVQSGAPAGVAAYQIEEILSRLQLDGARPLASLSGGEARRASLARALAGEPDVLLLDEPTNHLDLPTIEWLERHLAGYAGGVLLISHDRAFLSRMSDRTFWLDRGKLRVLERGYAHFEAWSDTILEEEEKTLAKLEKRIESETEWLGRSITARRKRNEGRKRRLLEMRAARANWVGAAGRAKLAAATEDSRSRLVIETEGISKSFAAADGTPRALVKDFSTRIMRGDRIGIIGPNGAGKTTLVRLLTGQLEPDTGTVRLAKTVTPAYFDQRRASLDPAKTLWNTLVPDGGDHVLVRGRPRHVVAYLRDFLFDEKQAKTLVRSLSGGERNRLLLARTLAQPSNLLVLDEPTNDLDVDTLDLLQEVLDEYEGTLLLVSHDRDFLDRLVNGTFVLLGDGRVREYAGGYSDYLIQSQGDRPLPQRASRAAEKKPAPEPPRPQRARMSYKEARELETLGRDIEALTAERDALEAQLADPTLYERDRAAFDAATRRTAEVRARLAEAEERWLELEMRREALARE